MTDLETLFPGREIAIGDKSLMLKPLSFGQLPRAAKLLQPIAKSLNGNGLFAFDGKTGVLRMASDWPMRLIDIMADSGDVVMAFLALASGQDAAWIEALAPDDGVLLARHVIEINSDFFVQKVLPVVMPKAVPTGVNASESSLEPATVAPTSTATPSSN